MPIIKPRMLGLLPDGVDKATFYVADKSNVERRIFDTDGELYTPDGSVVSDKLNTVELNIGSRTYTEQNYVTNGETVTASIDALDVGVTSHLADTVYLSNPPGSLTSPILNGVADDTVAIQAIIDYCILNKKQLVWNGIARIISNSLTISGKISIVGIGGAELIVDAGLINKSTIYIESTAAGTKIEGLTITENTYDVNYHTISIKANNCIVSRCTLIGEKETGIYVANGVDNTRILDNNISNYYHMINLMGSTNNIVIGNYITGGLSGVSGSGNGIKMSCDNQAVGFAWGDSDFAGAHKNVITNNIFDSCRTDCIDTFTDGSETICANNIFRNWGVYALEIKNIFRDAPYTAGTSLEINRLNKNIIISNNIFEDSVSTTYAIRIANEENRSGYTVNKEIGVQNININGNIFKNIYNAIVFLDSKNVNINGNIFIDITQTHIGFTGVDNVSVIGNQFFGSLSLNTGIIRFTTRVSKSINIADNMFIGNRANVNVNWAIEPYGEDFNIHSNKISDFDYAINDAAGLINVLLLNNIINNCVRGIQIGDVDFKEITIQGNSFKNLTYGIRFPSVINKAVNVFENANVYKTVTSKQLNQANVTNRTVANEVDWGA